VTPDTEANIAVKDTARTKEKVSKDFNILNDRAANTVTPAPK